MFGGVIQPLAFLVWQHEKCGSSGMSLVCLNLGINEHSTKSGLFSTKSKGYKKKNMVPN
jgi:hypothetical protein